MATKSNLTHPDDYHEILPAPDIRKAMNYQMPLARKCVANAKFKKGPGCK